MAAEHQSTDLTDFLHRLDYASLPQGVHVRARQCLLDALGCGLFGSLQPWSQMLASDIIDDAGSSRSTIIGHDARVPAFAAALCNGVAIHGYELDDLIASSIIHPAAAVVPAALAVAEANGASGERLALGIVTGYEIMHRVARAMGVTPSRRGFHVTSLTAPLGAAMAAGVVAGLDRKSLVSAIGISCSAAAGIKAFSTGHGGGMVKRLHLGRAAEAGVRASQLARRGFTGPPFGIDGKYGMLEIFGGETAEPGHLSAHLGESWAIEDIWFKVYPICGWIQSVVQILCDLRGDREIRASDIASIRVGVSSYAAANNGDPAPVDTMGAQYSIPFCAALALLGNPRDPAEYGDQRLNDPQMRDLQSRVELHVSEMAEAVYPQKYAAEVEVVFSDGASQQMSVTECRGTPADPCSDADLESKFMTLSTKALDRERARTLARTIARFDELAGVDELVALLRPCREQA